MSNTPSELETLAEIERQKAAGKDPFGDDELDLDVKKPEETGEDADESDDDKQSEGVEDDTKDDQTAESDGDDQVDELALQEVLDDGELQTPQYRAEVPSDYKTQRAELLKSKADAMKKLMDGEMEAEEFAAEEARISDALEELTAQRIRAETLIEANQQATAQMQQREIQKLIASAKAQVDYIKDAKAQKQFDVALQAINADPDNAGKDYADLIGEAHKVVLALRGIQAKPAASKTEPPPVRKPDAKPPVTLRGLPAASTPNSNGDFMEQMSRLSGQAYQEAFNKLSPSQRKALLDEE